MLLNLSNKEWEQAEAYFKANPKAIKIKGQKSSTLTHSFVKIENEIFAIANRRFISEYKEALLGEGAFGKVKVVQTKEGKNFALKIEGGRGLRDESESELKVMRLLKFIKGQVERTSNKNKENNSSEGEVRKLTDKKLYTVMRLVEGKELFKSLEKLEITGRLTEELKIKIAYHCCQALQNLHDKGIIHADVKTENFMCKIDGDTILIEAIDFGFSMQLDRNKEVFYSPWKGTPGFIAPEIIEERYYNPFSFASDVFALGVVFQEMSLPSSIYKSMLMINPHDRSSLKRVMNQLENLDPSLKKQASASENRTGLSKASPKSTKSESTDAVKEVSVAASGLLNLSTREWEVAEKYFEENPAAVKMKKTNREDHSFVKISDNIVAVANKRFVGEEKYGLLGEGETANSKVKLVQTKSGDNFALKIEGSIKRDDDQEADLKKIFDAELKIMKKIGFSKGQTYRELSTYKRFRNKFINQKMYTLIKYLPGEELANKLYFRLPSGENQLNKLDEYEKLKIADHCCQVVQNLHEQGIVHGDVNPNNFMYKIDGDTLLMASSDFSHAMQIEGENRVVFSENLGNDKYAAPEINFTSGINAYSFASDVYSLGIMFKELDLSDTLCALMLKGNPDDRISLKEVMELIKINLSKLEKEANAINKVSDTHSKLNLSSFDNFKGSDSKVSNKAHSSSEKAKPEIDKTSEQKNKSRKI